MINLENTHPHPTKEKLLFIKIRPKKYFVSTVYGFPPPLRSPIQFQNKSDLIFILWVLYLLSVNQFVYKKYVVNCLISARPVITDLIFAHFRPFFSQPKNCVLVGPTDRRTDTPSYRIVIHD